MKPDESKIRKDNFCSQATSDEICNNALKHYDKLSQEDCNWLSTVPHAIEIYRKYLKKELIEPMSESEIEEILQNVYVNETVREYGVDADMVKIEIPYKKQLATALVGKIGKGGQ